jgi:hypothetical protein
MSEIVPPEVMCIFIVILGITVIYQHIIHVHVCGHGQRLSMCMELASCPGALSLSPSQVYSVACRQLGVDLGMIEAMV